MNAPARRAILEALWREGVEAVGGQRAVETHLKNHAVEPPTRILAVGKAASGMALGALAHFPKTPALVVTKYGHSDAALRAQPQIRLIESAHPVPDHNSLLAGDALLQAAQDTSASEHILLLVSGGASALAEALPEGSDLSALQSLNARMLSDGLSISEINRERKTLSGIKDGKLIAASAARFTVLAISDVEGDGIDTIGSGIGDPWRSQRAADVALIATNRIARERVATAAASRGIPVQLNTESLYDDVYALAAQLGETLSSAAPGLYIWGGEPTIVLPPNPGEGGRNQALALATSQYLAERDNVSLLVAGTDGTDGPTDAAGGVVCGETWRDSATTALQAADAGTELQARNALFKSGPTNTNVMDLAIALVT